MESFDIKALNKFSCSEGLNFSNEIAETPESIRHLSDKESKEIAGKEINQRGPSVQICVFRLQQGIFHYG